MLEAESQPEAPSETPKETEGEGELHRAEMLQNTMKADVCLWRIIQDADITAGSKFTVLF